MTELNLFDAHCYVGRYKTFRPGTYAETARLIEQMDHFGIKEALVTHTMSRELHPVDGNAAVLAETRGRDRLHPCWALLPAASGELPPPRETVPAMIAQGVRAARLFYESYHFLLSEWCIGSVLEELEEHCVPTFLDPDSELDTWESDRFDWDAVDRLCSAHPKLPVILSEARFRSSNRVLYQLMERHHNLHIELSGFWAYHGIEFVTRKFGAHRLLFGTRMPVRNPACAVGQLVYSDISDDEKKLIAGDNLRRLLGGVVA